MKTKDYIIIAVFVIVIVILLLFRKEIVNALTKSTNALTAGNTNPSTQPVALDRNRTLAKGVNNSEEVKELQRLLGALTVDGDFGQKTEDRLDYVKGVRQTTLNIFASLPDVGMGGDGGEWEAEDDPMYSGSNVAGYYDAASTWIMGWVS